MRAPDDSHVYLTDGVFLYRVTGLVPGAVDAIAEVEDCYSLDVVLVPVRELIARQLRLVTVTPRDDAAAPSML